MCARGKIFVSARPGDRDHRYGFGERGDKADKLN
jgi:hypothetical protein